MPLFNIAIVLALIAVPVMWASKAKGYGLWSALLNLLCCVAAGGVAFALWEPLLYKFVLTRDHGLLRDVGSAVCLLGTYIIALFAFRMIVDSTIKANLKFSDAANFVGGAVFGLGAGVITLGISVIAFSNMRLPGEILGYEPLSDQNSGNLVYENRLWVPVDVLTVRFYETLSLGGFGAENALALHLPDAHIQAAMNRTVVTSEDLRRVGYTHIAPDAVKLLGQYRVDASLESLLTDTMSLNSPQTVLDAHSEPLEGPATLFGFVVQFLPGAREGTNQTVVGPGQVRLVCHNADKTEARVLNAVAIIAESDTSGVLARYPANSRRLYIASVGASPTTAFGFEYIVPNNWTPSELLIRGTRFPLEGAAATPSMTFDSVAQRDNSIRNRSLFEQMGIQVGGMTLGNIDTSKATMIPLDNRGMPEGFAFSAGLPFGFNIPVTEARGEFLLDEKNKIINGEGEYSNSTLLNPETGRSLRVNEIATPGDIRVVQVQLAVRSQASEFARAIDNLANKDDAPYLLAEDGRAFPCVGYIYSNGDSTTIRFKPDELIDSYSRLPALSVSQREESLVIIFLVNSDSRITGLSLGTVQAALFPRPVRQQ